MDRRVKAVLAALLVLAGVVLVAFYALLLGIADCAAGCQQRGERAVATGLMSVGAGLATMGALWWRRSARRAAAWGLLVAGALTVASSVYLLLAQGATGAINAGVAAVGALAAVGGWLLLRRA